MKSIKEITDSYSYTDNQPYSKGLAYYECEFCNDMTVKKYENNVPITDTCGHCGRTAYLDHITNEVRR